LLHLTGVTLIGKRTAEAAQNHQHAVAWHLRQMLPRANDKPETIGRVSQGRAVSDRDRCDPARPADDSGPSGRTAIADLGERYDLGAVLGRGGMARSGSLRHADPPRRPVKLLRSVHRDDDTIARFFREARVQGVLEHPAVVRSTIWASIRPATRTS